MTLDSPYLTVALLRRPQPDRHSQGVVTTIAVSPDKSPSLYEQSRAALSVLDLPIHRANHVVVQAQVRFERAERRLGV